MTSVSSMFSLSVGKKMIMGLTGLFLVSFLFVHLSGNLLLFKADGGVSFNEYTRFMTTNPIIRVMEWVLFAGFIFHIIYAAILTRQNRKARPVAYAYNGGKSGSSTWFSRNMGLSGSVILAFLIIHLVMFWGKYKFGDATTQVSIEEAYTMAYKVKQDIALGSNATLVESGTYVDLEEYLLLKENNQTNQMVKGISMTEVVKASFGEWYIVIFYMLSMVLVAFHLNHGFQSSFRTLGLMHKKYTPLISKAGTAISIVLPLIFAAMPLVFYIRSIS